MFFLSWSLWATWGYPRRPPVCCAQPTSSWDTVGMLGHVFDHQPPLTRSLQAVGAACSTNIVCKYCQKSMEINENQWKSMKTNGNQ